MVAVVDRTPEAANKSAGTGVAWQELRNLPQDELKQISATFNWLLTMFKRLVI